MTTAARTLRVTAYALVWALVAVLLLLASAFVHLDSPMGRRVAGQLLTAAVESQVPGQMSIGDVTHVGAGGTMRARDVAFETAAGERVVWGNEVDADLDVGAALSGGVRLTRLEVIGGGVRVGIPQQGRSTFERAFSRPGGSGPSKDAADIDLQSRFEALSLVVDVEGGPSLRFRELQGFVRVARAPSGWMRVRLDRVRGDWIKPRPITGNVPVRSLSGVVAAGADRIIDMRLSLELEDDALQARLEYFVEPSPRARLRVEGLGPKAVLASLGLAGVDPFIGSLDVERGDVSLDGPDER